ncbi:MAG: DUF4124 domain-containing protein [Proteobacteria bacterium]|nr:DUF4124 domain-containing protein [Pseudomonadota bacterium]
MRSWHLTLGRSLLGAVLLLGAGLAPGATTLYKWVDANGVTHYSDHPEPGSQKVRIAAAQTYQSGAQRTSGAPAAPAARAAPAQGYTRLEITAPADGAVLWNTGGHVDVGAALEPALADGHTLWIVVDGKPQQASPGVPLTLDIARGEHTLSASVTDAQGNELITSPTVSFVVKQTSIAQPPVGPALQKPKA